MFHLLESRELTPTTFTTFMSQQDEAAVSVVQPTPAGTLMVFCGIGEPAPFFGQFPFFIARASTTVIDFTSYLEQLTEPRGQTEISKQGLQVH